MRHENYYSSVAGDTSEASTTMHNLASIDESEGHAVRTWSDKPAYRQQCRMFSACIVLEACVGSKTLLEGLLIHPLLLPGTTVLLMIDWWTTVLMTSATMDHSPVAALTREVHRPGLTVRQGQALDCRDCVTAEWLRAEN